MEYLNDLLQLDLGGNNVREYLLAVGLFLTGILFFRVVFRNVILALKKIASYTSADFDDVVVSSINKIPFFIFILLSLYFPLISLIKNEKAVLVFDGVLITILVYLMIHVILTFIEYGFIIYAMKKEVGKVEARNAFIGIKLVLKIVLWAFGLLLILSNIGFNVTSLVASLGIGGVAIALAVQNILGDIFSSFSLYFDKPFVVGDYIAFDSFEGIVEKIGLKTTRIRMPQGEELIVSNKDLTNAKIRNLKRIEKRKVSFDIAVLHKTPLEKLKKINSMIENIIKNEKNTEFDGIYLYQLGDYGLKFSVVYYVLSGKGVDYLIAHQNINFKILAEFEREGIEMAHLAQPIRL